MRYLKTSEAAALLNVSPNTLRAWERRFGFPRPQRSPGRHRLYTHGEIAALRDALLDGLSISSAVSRAREGLGADTNALVGALNAFDASRADAALEGALALRSLDRAVQEVLLTALDEVARRHGTDSVQWAFAARWGNSWLRRAQRLVTPSVRSISVVLGDASRDDLDVDAAYIRALELLLARSGAAVLGLSVRGVSNMSEALAAHRPDVVVIAGGALGNLADRLRHGAVTDFIRWRWDEHRWPIFNVADAALVIGVGLLLLGGLLAQRRRTPAPPAAPSSPAPA